MVHYVNWFLSLMERSLASSLSKATLGVYASLGGVGDHTNPGAPSKGKAKKALEGSVKKCPCPQVKNHFWNPEECNRLKYALTGAKEGTLRNLPSYDEVKRTRENLASSEWRELRAKLSYIKQALMDQFKERISAEALGSGKSKIIAALLDPALFEDFTLGIYSTLGAPYALSNTTLLDNCAATHLVNREELLVPGLLKIAHP
ncbi:hypothetical protein B2J93_7285 [Marssonina coronariae]|uniref:Uncharacterized protein n=1 Tax=Diplocarpon coronariae TaxID=2795749 RepID=A0A218YVV9_9HELO|nr:hypothetical protein B2J93_7285 [Marssonina coronariae]